MERGDFYAHKQIAYSSHITVLQKKKQTNWLKMKKWKITTYVVILPGKWNKHVIDLVSWCVFFSRFFFRLKVGTEEHWATVGWWHRTAKIAAHSIPICCLHFVLTMLRTEKNLINEPCSLDFITQKFACVIRMLQKWNFLLLKFLREID